MMGAEGKKNHWLRSDLAFQKSEERFRLVVESVPNGIVMIGPTGLIEMVNAQTERMFGYTRNELLGKPIEMLVPERYRPNHPGLRKSFFAAPVSRPMGAGRDLYGLKKDGSEFAVEIGLNPIETDEGIMVLSAIVDISARKQLEQRLHAMNSMLTHMNRVSTVGELSASISHELKQPLTAMVANANAGLRWLANERPNCDRARATLKSIVSAGQRAGEIIDSLRSMYKTGSQEKIAVDIDEVIQNVLGLLRVELDKEGIKIQTEFTRPLPLVIGHGGQLQQVIANLIRNAAEAMASVPRHARLLTVKTAKQDPDGVLVSIEDSGMGIDPENVDHIFEAFFTTKSHGMGMGLSICRSIIEAHNGRLWPSPDVDHGATFNILLPVVPENLIRMDSHNEAESAHHST
jgi:two-component system, LuxR family, sensor kinase FixL